MTTTPRAAAGVQWIAPRLRGTVVACNVLVIAIAHAFGLKALKDLLAW